MMGFMTGYLVSLLMSMRIWMKFFENIVYEDYYKSFFTIKKF